MDQVTPTDADARARAGAMLLDVREPWEWEAGHAADAVHVPMGELGARLEELPHDRPIVCVCRSGNRSTTVARALESRGYEAHNLAGGMQAWALDGLDVVTDAGTPGRVA